MKENTWIKPEIVHGKPTKYGYTVYYPDSFILEPNTDIGCGTVIQAEHRVRIREGSQVGGNCCIYSTNSEDGTSGRVYIGANVNIGTDTTILPDVVIEDGARVGAKSLVKEGTHIKAGETWMGVPARKRENIVAVTGGTGSIGRVIVEELLLDDTIDSIRVISRDEAKHAKMKSELDDPRVRYVIADVTSYRHMCRAFHSVNTVIHAAAMKRVETSEYNAAAVTRVNTIGTENVSDACVLCNVKKMLLVSTDKAVNPAGVMGKSKSLAESIIVDQCRRLGRYTEFYIVRLGNVIGSRGAVLELWDEQRKSGRILLTEPDATRFFLLKKEAAHWILSVLNRDPGLHVPICRAARIGDMAQAYCELHDCEVEKIGMREGEKMHEELLDEREASDRNAKPEEYLSNKAVLMTVKELKDMLEAL